MFGQNKIKLLLIFSVFFTFVGCKPSESEDTKNSEVKTLDNFARKKGKAINFNSCGLSESDKLESGLPLLTFNEEQIVYPDKKTSKSWSQAKRDALENEVNLVLAQIPQSILANFFSLDNSQINLAHTHDHETSLRDVCSKFEKQDDANQFTEFKKSELEGTEMFLGCWEKHTDEHGIETGGVTIYIDPSSIDVVGSDEKHFLGVRHAMLRSFGYVLSQIFFNYQLSMKVEGEGDKKITTFEYTDKAKPSDNGTVFLKSLSDALIDAVDKSQGKYDLSQYSSLRVLSEQQFQYYVFAESFDSYYCSTDTRKLMKKEFNNSYCLMKKFDYDISRKFGDEIENEEFKKLLDNAYELKHASDGVAECDWESSYEGSEVTSFGLGNPGNVYVQDKVIGKDRDGKVIYQSPHQNGGYRKGGSYGGGIGYPEDNGCHIGCAIGGFFSSLFRGVGKVIKAVFTGVVYIVKGVIKIILFPFKLLFGVIRTVFHPYPGGGSRRPTKGGQIGVPDPCIEYLRTGTVVQTSRQTDYYKKGGNQQAPVKYDWDRRCKVERNYNDDLNYDYKSSDRGYDYGNNNDVTGDLENKKTVKKPRKKKMCGVLGSDRNMNLFGLLALIFSFPVFLCWRRSQV